jgi:branched-chain amino acid transport system substrate-binding protein
MKKYYPDGDPADRFHVYGYAVSQLTMQLLEQCGDNLTRENVMKQAENIKNFQIPIAEPGVVANTSPTDHEPFHTMLLVTFKGKSWEGDGEPVAVK